MATYKPGTTLRLSLVRVPIHESTSSPAYRETVKVATVLSSDERATVVRLKGVSRPERAIAQLTAEHLLVGFGGTGRPVKYDVLDVRESDPKRYPCAVYVEVNGNCRNLMSSTRTMCHIVDSRNVLEECRRFTNSYGFQIGCNGWSWDAGRVV